MPDLRGAVKGEREMTKDQELAQLLRIAEESRVFVDFTTPSGMYTILQKMVKRDDWTDFLSQITCGGAEEFIKTFLFDHTGLLRDITLDFLKSKKPAAFLFPVSTRGILGLGVNIAELMRQLPDTKMMVVSRNRYASFNRVLTPDEVKHVVEDWEYQLDWGMKP